MKRVRSNYLLFKQYDAIKKESLTLSEYGASLESDVRGDTSGPFQRLLVMAINVINCFPSYISFVLVVQSFLDLLDEGCSR